MYKLVNIKNIEDISLINHVNRYGELFLAQFAGHGYKYPLTQDQIEETLNDKNSLIFELFDADGQSVGHSQILRINKVDKSASIGRVVIYKEFRGKGLGTLMLKSLINFVNKELNIKNLSLRVFDFNKSAISCYVNLGFKEVARSNKHFENLGETWCCLEMNREIL